MVIKVLNQDNKICLHQGERETVGKVQVTYVGFGLIYKESSKNNRQTKSLFQSLSLFFFSLLIRKQLTLTRAIIWLLVY